MGDGRRARRLDGDALAGGSREAVDVGAEGGGIVDAGEGFACGHADAKDVAERSPALGDVVDEQAIGGDLGPGRSVVLLEDLPGLLAVG